MNDNNGNYRDSGVKIIVDVIIQILVFLIPSLSALVAARKEYYDAKKAHDLLEAKTFGYSSEKHEAAIAKDIAERKLEGEVMTFLTKIITLVVSALVTAYFVNG